MSWDSFRKQVKNLTNQAAVKINRSADIAALQAKLSAAKRMLEDAYTELGKAAYPHFAAGKAAQADQISLAMKNINNAKREIATLQAKIKELKGENASESGGETTAVSEVEKKPSEGNSNTTSVTSEAAPNPTVQKKASPIYGEDFCMDVSISSRSAESEGAITLDWNT